MSEARPAVETAPRRVGFFPARWRGLVPLQRLFWLDMVVVATLANIAATLAAVLLLGAAVPDWLALGVHFLPLPYNLFLFLAVWRTTELRTIRFAWAVQLAAALWLIAVTVA